MFCDFKGNLYHTINGFGALDHYSCRWSFIAFKCHSKLCGVYTKWHKMLMVNINADRGTEWIGGGKPWYRELMSTVYNLKSLNWKSDSIFFSFLNYTFNEVKQWSVTSLLQNNLINLNQGKHNREKWSHCWLICRQSVQIICQPYS
jgi:hypothetical protein